MCNTHPLRFTVRNGGTVSITTRSWWIGRICFTVNWTHNEAMVCPYFRDLWVTTSQFYKRTWQLVTEWRLAVCNDQHISLWSIYRRKRGRTRSRATPGRSTWQQSFIRMEFPAVGLLCTQCGFVASRMPIRTLVALAAIISGQSKRRNEMRPPLPRQPPAQWRQLTPIQIRIFQSHLFQIFKLTLFIHLTAIVYWKFIPRWIMSNYCIGFKLIKVS